MIITGFIAGVLAKAIVPGDRREPKGFVYTAILGIAGSALMGFVCHDILRWRTGGGVVGTIVGAVIGASVLILVFRKVWK
ncbi:MAG TPA: GlsB/YeaQ/YmgE family stress response membrane protein [Fimbriimonadaceae bacterium]|nr:GlsB/YeaQ/YmgE family stress response membrane protein [Fimbriimonadaceae bacterium]